MLELLTETINSMQEGQCLTIERQDLMMIRSNPFTGESGVDRLMSNVTGMAWNFDWYEDAMGGLNLKRIKSDGKRRYIDHDRRHLFQQRPDKTLKYKG